MPNRQTHALPRLREQLAANPGLQEGGRCNAGFTGLTENEGTETKIRLTVSVVTLDRSRRNLAYAQNDDLAHIMSVQDLWPCDPRRQREPTSTSARSCTPKHRLKCLGICRGGSRDEDLRDSLANILTGMEG